MSEDELRKLSKWSLAERLGRRLGMGGEWGFDKLPKDTLVAAVEALELPTFAAEQDSDEDVVLAYLTMIEDEGGRVERLVAEFVKVRSAEREACAKVAAGWALNYPVESFPDDAKSLDAKSAAHGRHVALKIADDIRARGEE